MTLRGVGRASFGLFRPEIEVHSSAAAHNGGNSVLEDQLLLAVVFQQHGVFVERADLSGELYAADQVDRDGALVFADSVEKRVLDVLRRL